MSWVYGVLQGWRRDSNAAVSDSFRQSETERAARRPGVVWSARSGDAWNISLKGELRSTYFDLQTSSTIHDSSLRAGSCHARVRAEPGAVAAPEQPVSWWG